MHAQAVLESTVVVNVCIGGHPCPQASSEGLQMNLTTPISDADAKAIFSPLSAVKILEFTSMLGVVSGFAEDADRERFYRRVRDYAGIWCCIQAHPVRASVIRTAPVRHASDDAATRQGHIWYDLLFDVPHTDRHNRVFNGTVFPLLTGP